MERVSSFREIVNRMKVEELVIVTNQQGSAEHITISLSVFNQYSQSWRRVRTKIISVSLSNPISTALGSSHSFQSEYFVRWCSRLLFTLEIKNWHVYATKPRKPENIINSSPNERRFS